MGALRADGHAAVPLSAVTRVGRDAENEIVIDAPAVSQFHAVIRWATPGAWELRDLGSVNGTRVDGVALKAGESVLLRSGSRVSFGGSSWEVADVSRPLPEGRDVVTGERRFGDNSMLSLGLVAGEPVDVFEESRGSWVIERDGQIAPVRNGQVVVVGGRTFRLSLPLPAPETEETPGPPVEPWPLDPLGHVELCFVVSSDLESVTMTIQWSAQCWECQRAYNRALLELARARLRDQSAPKLPPVEHGWVYGDELCTLADYDGVGRLNVEIHRARNELARRGIPNGQAIIQRRRGTGQLRLGTSRVRIIEAAARRR